MKDGAKRMPAVSDEFIAWVRSVQIPELHGLSTLTGEQALKQVSYSHGVLFLKALIRQGHEANKNTEGMKGSITPIASHN